MSFMFLWLLLFCVIPLHFLSRKNSIHVQIDISYGNLDRFSKKCIVFLIACTKTRNSYTEHRNRAEHGGTAPEQGGTTPEQRRNTAEQRRNTAEQRRNRAEQRRNSAETAPKHGGTAARVF